MKKLKVEYDTISPVSSPWETRCRARGRGSYHKRSSSQTKESELYLDENWELWKQRSPSFSRAEGMEACGERRHYLLDAKPPVILLAPYVLAEREIEGLQEMEIDRGREN